MQRRSMCLCGHTVLVKACCRARAGDAQGWGRWRRGARACRASQGALRAMQALWEVARRGLGSCLPLPTAAVFPTHGPAMVFLQTLPADSTCSPSRGLHPCMDRGARATWA